MAAAAPDQRVFVRAVLARLDLTPTELGDRLGKRNAYNAVNAWITDNPRDFRRVSFVDTMTMLDMCGWLSMSADVPGVVPLPLQTPGSLSAAVTLLSIQDGQRELGQKVLDQLAEIRSRLDGTPSTQQAKPKRRRGTTQ